MKYSIFWLWVAEEQVWNLTLEGDIAASMACSQTRTPSFNLWCCKNYKPLTLNNGPGGVRSVEASSSYNNVLIFTVCEGLRAKQTCFTAACLNSVSFWAEYLFHENFLQCEDLVILIKLQAVTQNIQPAFFWSPRCHQHYVVHSDASKPACSLSFLLLWGCCWPDLYISEIVFKSDFSG